MQGEDQLRARFERAYDEFLEPIYRYFYFRFSDRDRAKDLAQETFMRAWDYARRGNEIDSMKAFLYRTASNLFKNELRQKRNVVSLEVLELEGFEIPDEGTSAEERLEAKLLLQKLVLLSSQHQEVLSLRYIDGLTLEEIGELLGERSNTIAVRIHRALEKLRKLHETS